MQHGKQLLPSAPTLASSFSCFCNDFLSQELFVALFVFPKIIRISFLIFIGFFFFCKYLRLPQDLPVITVDSETVFINIGTPLASFARTQYVVPSISSSSFQDRGNPPDAMLHDAGALKSDIEDILPSSSYREYVLESTRSSNDRGGIRFLHVQNSSVKNDSICLRNCVR
jgi:hypothetical protein